MSFKVYHTKTWALNTLLHFNIDTFNPHMADYQIVADVHVDSIGPVFQLTNHIDHSWQENIEVTAYAKKARSTSVGDVVEDPEGQLWICASVGWKKVEWNQNDKESDEWWIENGERYATYAAEFAMA